MSNVSISIVRSVHRGVVTYTACNRNAVCFRFDSLRDARRHSRSV